MARIQITDWYDQWISENYPNAVYFVESTTGEVGVMLGFNEENEVCI